MKTTRNKTGYTVTGYTSKDELVQYSVEKTTQGWTTSLVYGQGSKLNAAYASKAQAVQAIKQQ